MGHLGPELALGGLRNPYFEAQKSQPRGSNSSLMAQLPALKFKSQPQISDPGLEAQILALRLKSKPRG